MKVKVDQELCVSCGACLDICPAVFKWNADEKADVIMDGEDVPENVESHVKESIESCPTEAIIEI